VLRSFVSDARRLGHMRFFEEVPTNASMSFDRESGLTAKMAEPDDEALRAAITQFRQLYTAHEPHSFSKVRELLKRSVHEHDGPQRSAALAALAQYNEAERVAMAGVGMGIVFEDATSGERNEMDTRKIIDAYLHGRYLHSGNDKSKLAANLDDIPVMARFTFYTVMLALRNLYWMLANAVDRVLTEDSLLDAK
jgi:hypothetical protein